MASRTEDDLRPASELSVPELALRLTESDGAVRAERQDRVEMAATLVLLLEAGQIGQLGDRANEALREAGSRIVTALGGTAVFPQQGGEGQ